MTGWKLDARWGRRLTCVSQFAWRFRLAGGWKLRGLPSIFVNSHSHTPLRLHRRVSHEAITPRRNKMLTPDQEHCYKSSSNWSDFRAMFHTVDDALHAYVAASQESVSTDSATHELEWRFIFHNRDSRRRQLLALFLLPLGHVQTAHAEFRFTTRHTLSSHEVSLLYVGRILGSIAYYVCFVALIAAGVGVVVMLVDQAFRGFSLNSSAKMFGLLAVASGLFFAAAKTRSLGLFGTIRTVAKDAFDLLSIRKLK